MRRALAYMIGSLERDWKGGRERMLCLITGPTDQETSGAQGNNQIFFLFVPLHTQLLLSRWQ